MACPTESVVALTATEGTQVEALVFVEGGALGGSISALDIPIDANGVSFSLVVTTSMIKTWQLPYK